MITINVADKFDIPKTGLIFMVSLSQNPEIPKLKHDIEEYLTEKEVYITQDAGIYLVTKVEFQIIVPDEIPHQFIGLRVKQISKLLGSNEQ